MDKLKHNVVDVKTIRKWRSADINGRTVGNELNVQLNYLIKLFTLNDSTLTTFT